MNGDFIFVNYDIYSFMTPITIYKNGRPDETREIQSNISLMGDMIATMAQGRNIYDVKIICPQGFFEEISDVVKNAENNLYSTNKITMELIQ